MQTDVVIIGGGPGGSVAAARLAQHGVKALVFEKERFPRFHLGESLLPHSLLVLQEIGALEKVEATFLRKYGARFHDDVHGRKERFTFATAWKGEHDFAFQVPRDAFDQLLLAHARSLGADVREEHTVHRIVFEDGRAVGVEASAKDGAKTFFPARIVIDASGRDALRAHDTGTTQKIDGLDQTALFAHYENVPREAADLAGDIDIVLFPNKDSARPNWFWFIPFKDGRTSVGAVVSRAFIRDAPSDPTTMLERAIAASPTATSFLASAKRVWPSARAAADFSYRVGTHSGPGWIAVGDASGFIDPLFSTGAHIAMVGAKNAADLIAATLKDPSGWDEGRAAWEKNMRAGAETFILAVQGFYKGPLVDLLFMPDKHTAIRRSITSLLAGDVFHDAVWLRDVRLRLASLTSASPSA